MARITKPKYTLDDLGTNNFSDRTMLLIPVRRVFTRDAYTKNKIGEETNYFYDAEKTEFTKVFITTERRLRVNALSPAAKEMFLWLLYTLESGHDDIWIHRERYMKELNIKSNTTFVNAIKDLVKHNIIAPTLQRKDVYWINPNFIFSGNRLKKYDKNKVYSDKDKARAQYEKDLQDSTIAPLWNTLKN